MAVFALQTAQSQIVNIPDANFKNALLNHSPVIDTNGDGEIQVSEAEAATYLRVSNQNIFSVEGIQAFSNIGSLYCEDNQLTNLDVSGLSNLGWLFCHNNQLTSLDVSGLSNLIVLACFDNQLSYLNVTGTDLLSLDIQNNLFTSLDNVEGLVSIKESLDTLLCQNNLLNTIDIASFAAINVFDCSSNPLLSLIVPEYPNNLYEFACSNTDLTELNLSTLSHADVVYCANNNQLTYLNLKNGNFNGNNDNWIRTNLSGNPNLEYLCIDEFDQLGGSQVGENVVVNTYCSFIPGGEFFIIEGETKIDLNSDGCDINDVPFPNLKFDITEGSTSGFVISNTYGNYSLPVQEGTHTLTPVFENTSYFTISPSSVSVTFPTETSPYTQDFCITPNGTHNDLEVTIIPLNGARPGFDSNYKLVYKNKGTTTLSGTVDFTFDDDLMDLVSTNPVADSQSTGILSWNYSNLLPFESREILVTMNLNTPTETPPLNGNDRLGFTATVNPVAGDETMEDNTFELSQLVVNSFDPNDKTCLEGNTITPDLIGEYVNYLIRFENTGTANAINIVVKDMIDTVKFDVSTLFLTDSSHDLVTRISGNKVEFIFENINLPFDDANNDGYIAFKIKTLDTLVEGDTFENDAQIFFDYNFPIQTNVAQTSIQSPLSTADFESSGFEIYPNPSQDKLFIKGLEAIKSVSIYDISGRLINEVSLIGTRTNIEISTEKLGQGAYFVKVKTNVGEFVKKVVKN